MRVLGIETSCDETSAAVVEGNDHLLSNVVATSMDLHVKYGGVVPEIAARSHIEAINPVIEQALKDAKCTWRDIDAIGVTYGGGLGGSLLVGVMAARTLAIVHRKPLYAINHVEAHVYANFLTSASPSLSYTMRKTQPKFPMLAIIVSGKHADLDLFHDHFDHTRLGRTNDDAIGEAFDKVAKILGLPYPGGPSIANAALKGNDKKYSFPKAKMQNKYDFSFSGLKTAVLRLAQKEIGVKHDFPSTMIKDKLSAAQKADIAASFQRVAIETIVEKAALAYEEFKPKSIVIAGGVAASHELRKQLTEKIQGEIEYPDFKLCTDNGAMIAALTSYKHEKGQPAADPYTLDIDPNLSM